MNEFPYKVITTRYSWEAEQWCAVNLSKRWFATDNKEGVWTCFWAGREEPNSYIWHFRNEQDAMLFTLMWT